MGLEVNDKLEVTESDWFNKTQQLFWRGSPMVEVRNVSPLHHPPITFCDQVWQDGGAGSPSSESRPTMVRRSAFRLGKGWPRWSGETQEQRGSQVTCWTLQIRFFGPCRRMGVQWEIKVSIPISTQQKKAKEAHKGLLSLDTSNNVALSSLLTHSNTFNTTTTS